MLAARTDHMVHMQYIIYPHLRNDELCVQWGVKTKHTIHYMYNGNPNDCQLFILGLVSPKI